MTKLSIVTINYNNAKGLEAKIKSVVFQTFTNYEFIVIDGDSIDESKDIILKYSDKISFWVSEKDTGIYNAQNKGLANAKGEYCLFLNSGDCLINEDVLSRVFTQELSADIIYGDMITVDKSGNRKYFKMPDRISIKRMLTDTVWHPASFIKKELFSKYGNYNESYKIVADYEFFVRVIISKRVSTFHIPFEIALFDTSGISSEMAKRNELEVERKKVQDNYFNPVLLFFFRLYSKLRN